MLRTFNCGVGLIFVVPAEHAEKAVNTVDQAGREALVIGRVTEGDGKVHYKGSVNYG